MLIYILNKIQIIKTKIRIWNNKVFGNVHSQVKGTTSKLSNIQDLIQKDDEIEVLLREERGAQVELDKTINIEEILWHEKSIINLP